MTKYDILDFLNVLRKSLSDDPYQKWIGSYNGRQIVLNKFFRWLYNPDEPDQSKRETPLASNSVWNKTILLILNQLIKSHVTFDNSC
jgi:hypothetical protein